MIAAGLLCRHILFFASPRSITCLLIQKHSLCCSQFSWFYHCLTMDQKVTISRNWEMIDIIIDWLLVWNMNFMIFHSVGNFIIPTDEVIFFRGVGIPPARISMAIFRSKLFVEEISPARKPMPKASTRCWPYKASTIRLRRTEGTGGIRLGKWWVLSDKIADLKLTSC